MEFERLTDINGGATLANAAPDLIETNSIRYKPSL
jgi:hypothetical protein